MFGFFVQYQGLVGMMGPRLREHKQGYPDVCPHTNEAPNDPLRGMNPLPVEDALLIIPFQNWLEANNIRTSTTLHFQ